MVLLCLKPLFSEHLRTVNTFSKSHFFLLFSIQVKPLFSAHLSTVNSEHLIKPQFHKHLYIEYIVNSLLHLLTFVSANLLLYMYNVLSLQGVTVIINYILSFFYSLTLTFPFPLCHIVFTEYHAFMIMIIHVWYTQLMSHCLQLSIMQKKQKYWKSSTEFPVYQHLSSPVFYVQGIWFTELDKDVDH
jgi:hypothetical protein